MDFVGNDSSKYNNGNNDNESNCRNSSNDHDINMPNDMPKLILSIGSNASRYMLKSLVTNFNRPDLLDTIDSICSVQELGCYQVEYVNKFSDEKELVYILIAPCDKDHNLTEQLDKLKVYVSDDEWAKVLKSLSTLVLLTRSIYSSIYLDNKKLFDSVVNDTHTDYSKLSVDLTNTTMYLPNIPERIGIFLEKN